MRTTLVIVLKDVTINQIKHVKHHTYTHNTKSSPLHLFSCLRMKITKENYEKVQYLPLVNL